APSSAVTGVPFPARSRPTTRAPSAAVRRYRSTALPTRESRLRRALCRRDTGLSPACGSTRDWAVGAEVRHQTYESPFSACLVVRSSQAERRFVVLQFNCRGWARPFPRTGCAPARSETILRHMRIAIVVMLACVVAQDGSPAQQQAARPQRTEAEARERAEANRREREEQRRKSGAPPELIAD